jgi:hypothetical protein
MTTDQQTMAHLQTRQAYVKLPCTAQGGGSSSLVLPLVSHVLHDSLQNKNQLGLLASLDR